MDNTALMLRLLKRLKVEMNGAVTEAMEQGGIHYPLNYGVSVPTIKQIAREYGPNHSLALLLYQQQVRELKISALFIEDPKLVTPSQVTEWSRDFRQSEIVELTVMYLFSHCRAAGEAIGEWIGSCDALLQYAALLMISRTTDRSSFFETMRYENLLSEIDRLLAGRTLPSYLLRAATNAIGRCAALSPSLHQQANALLLQYKTGSEPHLNAVASELEWMI